MMAGDKASGTQAGAAAQSSEVQRDMFDRSLEFQKEAMGWQKSVYGDAKTNLSGYQTLGQRATDALGYLTGLTPGTNASGEVGFGLLKPFGINPDGTKQDMTAALESTPGYQFTRDQGLKAVTNSNTARGLGTSGNALKEAASYATGLAQNTYGEQYKIYQDQLDRIYNRLMGMTGAGQNAAVAQGNVGVGTGSNISGSANSIMANATQTGSSIGSNTIGAANARGASTMASANAVGNAASGASNAYMTNKLIDGMYG